MRASPNRAPVGICPLVACCLAAAGPGGATAGPSDTSPFTTVEQVREITPEQADKNYPVHLRGVVTFSDWNADQGMFLQDQTAGIYIGLTPAGDLPVGEEVEVEGTTTAGDYIPYVRAQQVRRLGSKPLPEPHRVSYEQLATGKEDSQWVEVRGVVRSVIKSTMNRARVDLLVNGQRLTALVGRMDVTNAQRLVCATVRVRGVCRTRFNRKRQLRAPYLSVSSSADIVVELPAPGNPVEVPMASLLQFNSEGYYGRRVEVRGVVTEQKGSSRVTEQKGSSSSRTTVRPFTSRASKARPSSRATLSRSSGSPCWANMRRCWRTRFSRSLGTRRHPCRSRLRSTNCSLRITTWSWYGCAGD